MSDGNKAITGILAILVLVAFVSYRARSFHYCVAGSGEAETIHISSGPCPGDESTDGWRRAGLKAKGELIANTISRAFGVN